MFPYWYVRLHCDSPRRSRQVPLPLLLLTPKTPWMKLHSSTKRSYRVLGILFPPLRAPYPCHMCHVKRDAIGQLLVAHACILHTCLMDRLLAPPCTCHRPMETSLGPPAAFFSCLSSAVTVLCSATIGALWRTLGFVSSLAAASASAWYLDEELPLSSSS